MKQPASIFNDVLGPIMVGPSSSHTAASVRIGRIVRDLCRGKPKRIVLTLAAKSSIANTYRSQGAEQGLAAGLLGFETDDLRITAAPELARQAGIELSHSIVPGAVSHPNTYHISALAQDGDKLELEAVSIGGGMISVLSVDGIPAQMGGDFHETLFFFPKTYTRDEAASHTEAIVRDCPWTLEDAILTESENGYLLELKTREEVSDAFCRQQSGILWRKAAPVLPMLSQKAYPPLPNTGKQILKLASAERLALPEIACRYEMLRSRVDREQVYKEIQRLCEAVEDTLTSMKRDPPRLEAGILKNQAHFLLNQDWCFGPIQTNILYNVTLLLEAKSAMRVITAAPTAGSCGLLPGTLYAIREQLNLPIEALHKGWLAAGIIGIIIAENATFAGEVGGCQAECGSASGMAAAAIVTMLGGTAAQALDAASMALQNVYGLTCDPIANRAEVPCLGKNIMGAINAYAVAQCVLAGFDAVVPIDETVEAMYQVGLALPPELRCTGLGGLAQTPTAQAISERLPGTSGAAMGMVST